MNNKMIRAIGAGVLVSVWLALTGFAWFGPKQEISDAERRPLDQMPEITWESIQNGKFMQDFESFTLDQFPLRDSFRKAKALFHYNVLQQGDNNGIYVVDGYAAKQEYPLNETSVANALQRFNHIYSKYLENTNCNIHFAIVPDKGYYLAEDSGHLAMDYEKLFSLVQEGTPWANHVDLTDTLTAQDYYRTDTHWRQEKLIGAAAKLCQAMGVTAPKAEDFTVSQVERPFYGVYYGQAALPMDAEYIYTMNSKVISRCSVFNHENNRKTTVYDMSKLSSKDLYDVYLSGATALLTITNPNATTDKELVVFRDSFGSSMVPLLVQDYKTVTLVDIRYINSDFIGNYLQFNDQDVLFMYSTLILNSSAALK